MFTVEAYSDGNWNKLGDVMYVAVRRGFDSSQDHVAQPATAQITLANIHGQWSPTGGVYSGTPHIGQSIRVKRGNTVLWTGFVMDIAPEAGRFGNRTVTLHCSDVLARLQRLQLVLPQAVNISSGEALKRVTAAAFMTDAATGTLTFTARPAASDAVRVGSLTYTFVDTPAAPYQVSRGTASDGSEAARYLTAAINDDVAVAGYGTGTVRHEQVSAVFEAGSAASPETLWKDEYETPNPDWLWVGLEYSGFDTLGSGRRYWAQRFTPTVSGEAQSVELYLRHVPYLSGSGDSITHRLRAEIYTENASGLPGVKLAEQLVERTFTWPQTGEWEGWETWTFATPASVVANTPYWLVLRPLKPVTAGFWFSAGWYGVTWRGTDEASSPWGMANYVAPDQAYWLMQDGYAARMKVTVQPFAYSRVTLQATARGAWANTVELESLSSVIAVSGSTLSGGTDYASQTIAEGEAIIDLFAPLAADSNALAVMQGITESEFGHLFVERDGSLRFVSRQWLFERTGDAPAITIAEFSRLEVEELAQNIANRVSVSYTPPRQLTSGVVARSEQVLQIPGRSGGSTYERWNNLQPRVLEAGARTFVIPYVQPESGGRMTAQAVYTPVPGTDYTVTDATSGGFDYTNTGRLKFSVAPTASGIEVTVSNTATGALYVHNLQIRGLGQVFYDTQRVTLEDYDSQLEYGIHEMTYDLPHILQRADVVATMIASHLLSRHCQPRVRLAAVTIEAIADPDTWLALDIGNVVRIQDDLLGLDARCIIMGLEFEYVVGGTELPVRFTLYDADNLSYWLLDSSSYSVLGQTTRLAI